MATLNGAPLDPAQARETLRYLSNELGLAPEEVHPARFEVERRLVDFTYADKDTAQDLQPVPLDRASHAPAAHEGGVGPARGHAPRLLPAGGLPGFPVHGPASRRSPGPTDGPPTGGSPWKRPSIT